MTALLYEVQTAHMLGFQTIARFRAAVQRGDVPGPSHSIGRCPVWSKSELQRWIDRRGKGEPSIDDALAEIKAIYAS